MTLNEELARALEPRLAGVTERAARVQIVASFLHFERGIHPANALVRQLVGVGSMTSIAADLRAFWEDTRKRGMATLSLPNVPARLDEFASALMGEALAKLWARAVEVANEELAEERAAMQLELTQARLDRDRADEARAAADERAHQLADALEAQRAEREAAERSVVGLTAELTAARDAFAVSEAQLAAEQAARRRAEEQFSQDLAAADQARRRDQEIFDGEIKFAKLQIDQARQAERTLRDQLKHLQDDSDLQIQTLRRQNGALRDELAAARAANVELERSVEIVRKQQFGRPRKISAAKGPALRRR